MLILEADAVRIAGGATGEVAPPKTTRANGKPSKFLSPRLLAGCTSGLPIWMEGGLWKGAAAQGAGWPAGGRGEPARRCMRGSGPVLRLCRRGAGGSGRAKSEHSQVRMFWQPFLAARAKLFITLCIFLLICVQPAPMAQLAFCLPEPSQSLGCARSWLSIHAFCLLQLCLEQHRIPN